MNIRKIIREELEGWEWVNDVNPLSVIEDDKEYKVWFGKWLTTEEKNKVLGKFVDFGVLSEYKKGRWMSHHICAMYLDRGPTGGERKLRYASSYAYEAYEPDEALMNCRNSFVKKGTHIELPKELFLD